MFRVGNILVLISIALTIAVDILDYPGLDVDSRPLPPELDFIALNKTAEERRLEECMNDYGSCIAAHKQQLLCGVNDKNIKRTFYTLCELSYENCKIGNRSWEYISDGSCGQNNVTAN